MTTAEVAQQLGISVRRVQAICKGKHIGKRIGRDWILDASDVQAIRRSHGSSQKRP